jgi:hypothetical protein
MEEKMGTSGIRAAALSAALSAVACGGSLAEVSDPVKDPAHVDAEQPAIARAADLTATEKVIKLGPLAGTEPPTEHHAPVRKAAWACPMHPDVVRDQPGNCPKCGMKLEAAP